MGEFNKNIAENLISNFFSGGFLYLVNRFRHWLSTHFGHRDPRRFKYFILLIVIGWIIINCIGLYLLSEEKYSLVLGTVKIPTIPIFSALLVFWFMCRELNCFWAVGVLGADKIITEGIDYEKSLKLCNNRLKFLGTGAAKLTKNKEELIKALDRCCCDESQEVQFLLLEPTSEKLTDAAKRANKPEKQYQKQVLDSLRVIASLKEERTFNIIVRFYQEPPVFRMMFIDDSLCLLSYNVFGKGDGSNLPQLHLVKRAGSDQENSFYHPASMYFEKIWEKGTPWDFKKYL